tara:strand:- start:827 stop:931 length:105 start_codon:yes stop_codon:yes gene_type:complete
MRVSQEEISRGFHEPANKEQAKRKHQNHKATAAN